MKQMLIEIDERCARDLERIAPAKERKRSEFIRLAIRRALDIAMDRATAEAYARQPLDSELTAADLEGWDENNRLAVHTGQRKKGRRRRRAPKRAA
jgi:Arc/MetJ-type ribon-helix-helix transcriptional regulator